MNEPLIEELAIVQNDYLSLLKELDENHLEDIPLFVIDSINIFWYENRYIVNLALEYLFKEKDTYCFSAAANFDVNDEKQNSFFLLGDYHIFDDPIPSYINTLNRISNEIHIKKMKSIISDTVKDNIKIIEDRESELIILPLRYLSVIINQDNEKLNELTETLFLSLFNNIKNFEEYQSKVKTTEEIINHIDKKNSASIILDEGDDLEESWKVRIEKYKKENDYLDTSKLSSGDIFYLVVYGHLRQSLGLIDMANNFHVLPFIRSFIPFYYYTLLSSMINNNLNFEEELSQVNHSLFKTKITHFLYQEYRKRDIDFSLKELKQRAINIKFEYNLLSDINNLQDSDNKTSVVIKLINKYLDQIVNC